MVDDVKTWWRSMRDQFRREYGSRGRSGDGGAKKRRYMYTDQLMFLKDIMEMRPTTDNLDDSQEEAGPESSHASEHATPLVPLTPDPTPEEPAPLASAPEPVEPPQPAAPRRRRPIIPSAGAQVDARVLDYLRRAADEDSLDFFYRSMAPLLRRVPEHRLVRLQAAMLSLKDSATPTNSPRHCFDATEQWCTVPLPSVGYNIPGPSQLATPIPRQPQYRPMPSHFSPGPMAGQERHFPTYSRPAQAYQPPIQAHGYQPQLQDHYAVQEHLLQGRGQHIGADMSAYTSPPHSYHEL
ncbi:uncharacterized protein LOC142741355 [Rhinoderma darwinii]|uniref:uncharacterized protein LOC142741355 n=1 Tax=Rhinoderma darwinii TaxID=43563 RepID=UPI003F663F5E